MSLAERRIQDSAQRLRVALEQELDLPASVARVVATRDVDASGDSVLRRAACFVASLAKSFQLI